MLARSLARRCACRRLGRHLPRGRPGSRYARRTTVRPAPVGGLWAAAVFGRYTMVRCQLTTLEGTPAQAIRPGGQVLVARARRA